MNRLDIARLLAGAAFATLFTATVFGPLGFGLRYADLLQRSVRTTLEERQLERVQVAVERRPALRRTVLLSGDVSPRERMAAIELARTVPGVAEVKWVDEAAGGGTPSAGMSARYP